MSDQGRFGAPTPIQGNDDLTARIAASSLEATVTGLLPGRSSPSSSNPELTRAGQILGTPAYIAPELAAGGPLTPAVDVFSLGVLAYQLLTGRHPFAEPPLLVRLRGHADVPPEPLRQRYDGLQPRAADAIDACLALRAEARPSTSELLHVFRDAKEQLESQVRLAAG